MTDFHIGKDIRLDTSDTHKYGEILLHSEKGEVCTVYPIDGEEDEPNFPACHLIAAAPDLYEALNQLIRELKDYQVSSSVLDAIDVSISALAKARGESS